MISRDHKTIFVHIPKNAGQSVEMAFLSDLGLTWETRESLLLKRNDDPLRGPPRLAHLRAADYVSLGYVSPEEFDAFFTFAIVRNPWSRAVSLYRHIRPNLSFRDFANVWLSDTLKKKDLAPDFWFVRPQSDFITKDGRQIVEDVLRFETLQQDFPRVAARVGLKRGLPHVNKANFRTPPDRTAKPSASRRIKKALAKAFIPSRFHSPQDWRDHYDSESVLRIGDIYAEDVYRFGYSYDAE